MNEYVNNTKEEVLTADEMFENLGYEKIPSKSGVLYKNELGSTYISIRSGAVAFLQFNEHIGASYGEIKAVAKAIEEMEEENRKG